MTAVDRHYALLGSAVRTRAKVRSYNEVYSRALRPHDQSCCMPVVTILFQISGRENKPTARRNVSDRAKEL